MPTTLPQNKPRLMSRAAILRKMLHRSIACANRFQCSDRSHPFQYQYQERSDHVNACYNDHQDDDHHRIDVLQSQPVKYLRIHFPDRSYIQIRAGCRVNARSRFIQCIEIRELYLQASDGRIVPIVQFSNLCGRRRRTFIEFLQAGFVDADDLEFACPGGC